MGKNKDKRIKKAIDNNDLSKVPERKVRVVLSFIMHNEADNLENMFKFYGKELYAVVANDNGEKREDGTFGSTDGSKEILLAQMEKYKLKGKVYESRWDNHAVNRTECIEETEKWIEQDIKETNATDVEYYIVFADCDDYYIADDSPMYNEEIKDGPLPGGLKPSKLNWSIVGKILPDYLMIDMECGSLKYDRRWGVRYNPKIRWMYESIVHEYLTSRERDIPIKEFKVPNCKLIGRRGGARSKDPKCHLRDGMKLIREIYLNPDDPLRARYLFYIAQSFRDSGVVDEAEYFYKKRTEAGSWYEEIYISHVEIAKCRMSRNKVDEETIDHLFKAIDIAPHRLEAPFYLVRIWRLQQKFRLAWAFARGFLDRGIPNDRLFVDLNIHRWQFKDEAGICAFYANDKKACEKLCREILALPFGEGPMGELDIERIKKNLNFSIQ